MRAERRRSRLRGLLLVVLLGGQSHASAQQATRPALHWSRATLAAGCIEPRALAARVEALTGPVFVAPAEADASIEGHIDARPAGGFHVRFTVTDRNGELVGERILEFAETDCRALDAGLALVIATLIDPALGERGLPPELLELGTPETAAEDELRSELERDEKADAAEVAAAPAVAPPRAPATRAQPVPASERRPRAPGPRFELGLGALFGSGVQHGVAAGALAYVGWLPLEVLALRLQADARFDLEARSIDPIRSLQAYALTGALVACPLLFQGARVASVTCVGADLGIVVAHGQGFVDDRAAQLLTYGVRALLGLRLRVGGDWAAGLSALAQLGLAEKRFEYQRGTQLHRAAPLRRFALSALIEIGRAF